MEKQEIKRLPENTKSFEAGGRKFIVHDSLTVDGYQMLEELRIRAEIGDTSAGLLKQMQSAYKLLNDGKFADSAVKLYNAIATGERMTEKQYTAWLLILTLFIRPEGSDLAKWDENEASEWLDAWANEKYDSADLFRLAAACQMRYTSGFLSNSPTISEGESDEAGESKSKMQPAAKSERKQKRSSI